MQNLYNPYLYSLIGLLAVVLQFILNMNIARQLLPRVRKAHELPLDEKVKLIADASLETLQIRFQRIFVFLIIYLPVLGWLTWKEKEIWPSFAFMLVACAQAFIIWIASNHAKIVNIQLAKFSRNELVAYLTYIEKDSGRKKRQ